MSVVDEIKSRLDIIDVISKYIPLQKSGRNYKACCPFHSEKTPSFVVFPESQRWHCFGACSEGGDIFTFVMKQEGWDFRTALEELAKQAGVELKPRTPAQQAVEEKNERLHEMLEEAARYYNHLLHHAPEAEAGRAYAAKRGLKDETIDAFLVGYSLPGWDHTRSYLTGKGYSVDELLEAGLLVKKEETGSTYDRFRERLMITIRDLKGRVIGFGARTLEPKGIPKYINSPQTALFDKSHTLFGLDLARRAIHRQDQVIIVEGYMDVMQAHQAGFKNVVAQMGTALTEPQLKQLQRYTKRLVLALDPDAAGINATLRGVEVAQETLEHEWEPVFDPRGLVGHEARLGAEIRILQLPEGQDPDDLIRDHSEQWQHMVDTAVPVVDFYLNVLTEDLDLKDTKAKAQVVDALLPVLRAVANPIERDDYLQKIARTLRVSPDSIRTQLQGKRPAQRISRHEQPASSTPTPARSSESDMERYCLSAFLKRPSLLQRVNQTLNTLGLDPISDNDFQETACRAIFQTWQNMVEQEESDPVKALRNQTPDHLQEEIDALLTSKDKALSNSHLERDVAQTLLRLRERNLKQTVANLEILTREAQSNGDSQAREYAQSMMTYTQTLFKTQKALAQI